MEWLPDPAAVRPQEVKDMLGTSARLPDSLSLLSLCWGLLHARSPLDHLSLLHTVRLLRCLDVDVEGEERMGRFRHLLSLLKKITEASFPGVLHSQCYYEFQNGRFFVALSLTEAAGIRALIHTWRQYEAGRCVYIGEQEPVPALALRMCGTGALQDATGSFVPGSAMQLARAVQCLKYLNGDCDFSMVGQRMLLRSLQRSEKQLRHQFWVNMCASRRRKFLKLSDEPVTEVFQLDNELLHLACAALAHRLMEWIPSKGLGYSEAFEFLNQDGVLDLENLRKHLEFIFRMSFPPAFIGAFFDRMDTNRDGQISFMEFKMGVMSLTGATREESQQDGEAMIALVSGSQTITIQWGILGHVELSVVPAPQTLQVCSTASFSVLSPSASSSASTSGSFQLHYPIGHSLSVGSSVAQVPCILISSSSQADIADMIDAHFLPFPRSFILAATVEIAAT